MTGGKIIDEIAQFCLSSSRVSHDDVGWKTDLNCPQRRAANDRAALDCNSAKIVQISGHCLGSGLQIHQNAANSVADHHQPPEIYLTFNGELDRGIIAVPVPVSIIRPTAAFALGRRIGVAKTAFALRRHGFGR